MWEGRHGNITLIKQEQETKVTKAICITNYVSTASKAKCGSNRDSPSKINRSPIEITQIINKPEPLHDITDIPTWIEKMETYLETINKEDWYKITISYIDTIVLKKINLISKSRSDIIDRYDDLKNQLLKIDKKNYITNSKQRKLDLKTMGERKQLNEETIEEYGKAKI